MPSHIASHTRRFSPIVLALCLAACGGGGGTSTPPVAGVPGTPTSPILPVLPAIAAQPQNVTTSVGASVSFSVSATGDAPLSYQWQRNGVDVAGATGAQLVLPSAQWSDSGTTWNAVVRNGAGSASSVPATLKVTGTALLAGSLVARSFVNVELVGAAQDASGNTYVLETSQSALYKVSAQGVVSQIPLSPTDGAIALGQATAIARDAAGNFYVADRKCTIRKISPSGVIGIFAGTPNKCGHDDGKADATISYSINAIALDAANNLYIADQQATVRKISPDGVVTSIAGVVNAFGVVDGVGSAARFGGMQSMAIDGAGNIYVTDSGSSAAPAIRKITPGGVVTTLAGGVVYGPVDGQGSAASFSTLSGLTIDSAGNLYVGDQGNHSIRKVTPGGLVSTFSGRSSTQFPAESSPIDGPPSVATFNQPVAMTIDGSGTVYLVESYPGLSFNALRKISPNGTVTTITGTLAGRGTADGTGAAARFAMPHGLAVDASGTVWVADSGNALIRRVSAAGAVTTLAGGARVGFSTELGDGKGVLAGFFEPSGIVVDSQGTAFVADLHHNTLRKVLGDGTVTTLAGQPGASNAADGIGSAARFAELTGVTAERTGMLYVSDFNTVRRIDPATGAVTTIAGPVGSLSAGSVDGTGSTARFGYLPAIAIDSASNLYVVDKWNNNVRKITPGGVVTTLAGTAGASGSADGQGAAARFNNPQGIAVDAEGNVYVADTDNDLIRRITPAGMVTTVAGTLGANGNVPGGLNSPLSQPTGLAFDANGILYVCASNGVFQVRF